MNIVRGILNRGEPNLDTAEPMSGSKFVLMETIIPNTTPNDTLITNLASLGIVLSSNKGINPLKINADTIEETTTAIPLSKGVITKEVAIAIMTE
jgi:hypothetical protein